MNIPFKFSISAGIDTGMSIYARYTSPDETKVGYAAHFGGALAGKLFDISNRGLIYFSFCLFHYKRLRDNIVSNPFVIKHIK